MYFVLDSHGNDVIYLSGGLTARFFSVCYSYRPVNIDGGITFSHACRTDLPARSIGAGGCRERPTRTALQCVSNRTEPSQYKKLPQTARYSNATCWFSIYFEVFMFLPSGNARVNRYTLRLLSCMHACSELYRIRQKKAHPGDYPFLFITECFSV